MGLTVFKSHKQNFRTCNFMYLINFSKILISSNVVFVKHIRCFHSCFQLPYVLKVFATSHSLILLIPIFNIQHEIYKIYQGLSLQCLLKVKEDLS